MSVGLVSINDLTKKECKQIAYYFYILLIFNKENKSIDKMILFDLFSKLVIILKKEEKLINILNCIKKTLINRKCLTKSKKKDNKNFQCKEKTTEYFLEDKEIFSTVKKELDYLWQVDFFRCIYKNNYEISKLITTVFLSETDKFNESEILSNKFEVIIRKEIEVNSNIANFANKFKLTKQETELLQIVYLNGLCKEFNLIYNNIDENIQDNYSSLLKLYTTIKGYSLYMKKDYFSKSKLISYNFIDESTYEINFKVLESIKKRDISILFYGMIRKNSNKTYFPLDTFSVNSETITMAKNILNMNSPVSILIYGASNSGKTEFAKSLVNDSGKIPLLYVEPKIDSAADEVNPDQDEIEMMKLRSLLSYKQENSVIIIDNAQYILKTLYWFFGYEFILERKNEVNRLVKNSKNKVIWILNDSDELDDSTKDCFNYSIKFDKMSKDLLKKITQKKIKEIKVKEEIKDKIIELCDNYSTSINMVNTISETVKNIVEITKEDNKIIDNVGIVLNSNYTLINGSPKKESSVNKAYELSVLNTTTPP